MPYLSKKRVWTQQPQGLPDIEWENPLTEGLIGLFFPVGDRVYDLVSKAFLTNSGTVSATVNSIGVATKYSSSSSQAPTSPLYDITTEGSLLGLFRYTANGGNQDVFGKHYSATGYVLEINSTGTLNLVLGVGEWQVTALGNVNVGSNTVACSFSLTTTNIYGVLNSGGVVSNTLGYALSTNTTKLSVGGSDNYGNYLNGDINLTGIWNRALSPSSLIAIRNNPWQLLKRQDRRIWIPSASGGVHTTTSILTSDVATISGTSLHKILHTVVGNLTSSAATLTGTSVHTTPSPTHNTVGVLSASNSSITGIAARYREHQTTGILTTTNATINGTTNNFSVITSTGVLSSNVATLAGVMSITPAPGIHISTGVLQSNSSTITGILTHTATGHTLTGTLVSSVATLNGNVAHNTIHSSSGTLVSSVATINGTASSSGIITLTPADIEAIANAVWQHPWALTLPKWLALK